MLCFAGYLQLLAKGKRFARILAQYDSPPIRGGVVCYRNRLGFSVKCVAIVIFNVRHVQIDGSWRQNFDIVIANGGAFSIMSEMVVRILDQPALLIQCEAFNALGFASER